MSETPPVMTEEPPVSPPARRPPAFTRKDLICLVLLLAVAFFIRAWRIDYPDREYFDEIYYVDAAKKIMAGEEDPNNVHPPLGKLQLGVGIELISALRASGVPLNENVGWRLGSLILGMAILPLTFYLGWIMPGGGRFTAFAATSLLSFDFMHLVQSRIAMLDMYQAFWIMVGTVAAWKYLEGRRTAWGWAVLAAAGFGAATACKWSGLFAAVGGYLAMVSLWPRGFHPGRALAVALLYAFVIPMIYWFSYTPLFLKEGAMGPRQFEKIVGYHQRMWKFRYNEKEFHHRYLSAWYKWPFVITPVWYVYEEQPKPQDDQPELPPEKTDVHGVVTIGNPFFWWTFLVFLCEATFLALVQRDRTRGFLACMYWPQLLLWASATTGGFIYYMLPVIPIMALTSGIALSEWRDSRFWRYSLYVYFGLVMLAFVAFFPLLTGLPVKETYFRGLFFNPSWI